ncbi:acetyltransferase [Bacillus manliponensis]|uniref:Acetyltransferase n=1 Tax=Bacillus manliponensis TaxID=574376 RepID=A0A073JWY4_9BACI|nr:GNAT family N-acetyltransferase [Bacillus manliponensis]KEK18800.1 acetyltransferase [Bacillus manliponensis]
MVQLHVYTDFLQFKHDILPFLMKYEQENNLILGVLYSPQLPLFMATVVKDGDLVGVMLQTHPRQVIVSKHFITSEDRKEFAKQLCIAYPHIPGLIGERGLVEDTAKQIAAHFNKQVRLGMNQCIYVLQTVEKEAGNKGLFYQVLPEEQPIIEKWVYEFCQDVHLPTTKEEANEKAAELIESHRLFGWRVNDELVSMAAVTRPTENNITVNYVYTPKEKRGSGYASSCVSALSQRMLNEGYKTTSLYTDLANPTSNKIYQKIGYKPVMESILLFLEEHKKNSSA